MTTDASQFDISIITITYNAAATLERTIQSVERQTSRRIEYIIVDGASTDGTMNVVGRYLHVVNRCLSESDTGIYNAMNKGLALSHGKYVWFLNAGDELPEADTVERMLQCSPDADVYYGDTVMTDFNGNTIGRRRLEPPERLTWQSFRRGMLVSHQSFIARRTLCPKYNERYRFSADFDWCIAILKQAQSICNTHMTLSRFLDGGITKHNIIAGLRERFRIMTHYYGFAATLVHHIPIAAKFLWFVMTKHRY